LNLALHWLQNLLSKFNVCRYTPADTFAGRTAVTLARRALVDEFMRTLEIVKPNLDDTGGNVCGYDQEMAKVLVQMSKESWAGVGLGPFKDPEPGKFMSRGGAAHQVESS
jgi:hypothetical protein